ncbi:MAG TPA: tannase/feruloyl esterase family alpha/beta hydrolase [Bryobacteraceae bacterium]|nr:tannase/feruloyl esterase family alpha/beta hydrolase [Bryobacteraceae bacterium]
MTNRLSALSIGVALGCATVLSAATCESLASLALPDTTITMAQTVAAGELKLPPQGPFPLPVSPKSLPAFCRVAATIRPSKDSDIKIEVWLPVDGWNGKFQGVGNGGWTGSISYPALMQALQRGYATASTDTGHEGNALDGSFALGHPEKVVDFGYRAVHEMTVQGKAITKAFYDKAPRYSYWNGCSSGGKQGLKEAQKYPADYDGIIAGAPANYWTHLTADTVYVGAITHKDPASFIPPAKYPLIHKAAIAACDATDGLKDGLIDDPRRCHFDPKELECKGEDAPTCLTAAQVESVKKIYAPATNPRTGVPFFPGLEPGSELGWMLMAGGKEPSEIGMAEFRNIVYHDANWDWRTFDFDKGIALAEKVDHGIITATDPNLKPFFGHGGKLLMYHGWTDPLIAPENSINYYTSVLDKMGGAAKASSSIRLFMAPGMDHCGGGEGPNLFDSVTALENWVENGKAPSEMIASHGMRGKVDRTRPLCPYPQVARYKGSGSIDDAANFTCATAK